jgi:UDPglucose--hexose-1-phosphate uridylyltransferase
LPELRKDPVVERWTIIAAERAKRPHDFKRSEETHYTPEGKKACQFCYGRENETPPEIVAYGRPAGAEPNTPGWRVRVVPNKFPALRKEGDLNRTSVGVYDRMDGIGAHEVIIETPEHERTLDKMALSDIGEMTSVFRDRIVDLCRDDRLKYVQVFKNFGIAAGASIQHPHCQLIATPVIPKRVIEELEGALKYYEFEERCVFCDIVRQDAENGRRVVFEDDYFVTIVPFASRFPFEIHVIPKRHEASFINISEEEIYRFSLHLKTIVGKINRALGVPPYNFMIHTAPCRQDKLDHYHWHLELVPKLTMTAGFELGTGLYINPTVPEQAADDLRSVPFDAGEAEVEIKAK